MTSPVDFADRRLKLLLRNFQHVEMNSFLVVLPVPVDRSLKVRDIFASCFSETIE